MKKKGSEVWVGVFVVIGILLLVLMTMRVEKFKIGRESGYLVNILFDSAAGLDRNAPVRVAGVHVGNVEKVALEKGKAKVTFRIPPQVILYQDAKAYLKSEGFLGEKYVEIAPGTPGFQRVPPDGNIEQGAPPADFEQVLSSMRTIREDLKEVTRPIGDILRAIDAKKVEGMFDNLSKFSSQLADMSEDAKETIQKVKDAFSSVEEIGSKVKKGEGTLGKLIADETIYQEARKTVETARVAAESVKEAADTLKNLSDKIERGEGTLGKLIQDESLYQEAKETIQSVRGIVQKVEKGEGTLGKLVSDDQLMKEAERTMRRVQKAAESIEEQTPITVLGTLIGIFF